MGRHRRGEVERPTDLVVQRHRLRCVRAGAGSPRSGGPRRQLAAPDRGGGALAQRLRRVDGLRRFAPHRGDRLRAGGDSPAARAARRGSGPRRRPRTWPCPVGDRARRRVRARPTTSTARATTDFIAAALTSNTISHPRRRRVAAPRRVGDPPTCASTKTTALSRPGDVDPGISAIVAACDGRRSLGDILADVAEDAGVDTCRGVRRCPAEFIRHLVQRVAAAPDRAVEPKVVPFAWLGGYVPTTNLVAPVVGLLGVHRLKVALSRRSISMRDDPSRCSARTTITVLQTSCLPDLVGI